MRAVGAGLLLLLVAAASASDTREPAAADPSAVAAAQAIRVADARGQATLEAALARGWRIERTERRASGTIYILGWPDGGTGPTRRP